MKLTILTWLSSYPLTLNDLRLTHTIHALHLFGPQPADARVCPGASAHHQREHDLGGARGIMDTYLVAIEVTSHG